MSEGKKKNEKEKKVNEMSSRGCKTGEKMRCIELEVVEGDGDI